MRTHAPARLRSAGLAGGAAALVALGLAVGPAASDAARSDAPVKARKTCRTHGGKVVKRKGAGLVFTRMVDSDRVFYACSTRYGRSVRLATDYSEDVDVSFVSISLRVSGRSAKQVWCSQGEDGQSVESRTADLKTRKVQETSKDVTQEEYDASGCS